MKPALAVLILGWITSCGAGRRGEPLAGAFAPQDESVRRGQIVFARRCDRCHPGGEAGLGPSINDKPLPGFLIRMQVRRGFGAMPAFTEEEMPDGEVEDVIAFLKAYRGHGG